MGAGCIGEVHCTRCRTRLVNSVKKCSAPVVVSPGTTPEQVAHNSAAAEIGTASRSSRAGSESRFLRLTFISSLPEKSGGGVSVGSGSA